MRIVAGASVAPSAAGVAIVIEQSIASAKKNRIEAVFGNKVFEKHLVVVGLTMNVILTEPWRPKDLVRRTFTY
jgi:hypothetical protein